MKVLFFANRMPDLCGAFLHDIDLAIELQRRGHQIVFLTVKIPPEGYNGGSYRGFRYLHYSAATSFLDSSEIWICPHSPILPDVRKINSRGYNRPIIATCHFDGNYTAITGNWNPRWQEMLCFINSIMEASYRKNVVPWPHNLSRTEIVRPIMHRDKIVIPEEFHGDMITLINANQNKGVHQFIDMARNMPNRKFLGVMPYYGEKRLPPSPQNIEWVPFDDDIRTILRRTRILLVPSYYESFGRVAVEAMINGIPVLYSKPAEKSVYPGGSTEGLQSWIQPAGIAVSRDNVNEWKAAIESLDDPAAYASKSDESKAHIESMNLFTEASRIAGLVESFARQNPVEIRSSMAVVARDPVPGGGSRQEAPRPREPVNPGRVGFGFSNGRLKIQR
jgi:glycosyltransferase involved in cell wall biosynthesis